jgi:hypothetical protein
LFRSCHGVTKSMACMTHCYRLPQQLRHLTRALGATHCCERVREADEQCCVCPLTRSKRPSVSYDRALEHKLSHSPIILDRIGFHLNNGFLSRRWSTPTTQSRTLLFWSNGDRVNSPDVCPVISLRTCEVRKHEAGYLTDNVIATCAHTHTHTHTRTHTHTQNQRRNEKLEIGRNRNAIRSWNCVSDVLISFTIL